MNKILIIGAASAIALASARLFAAQKAEFFLVGRNPDKLQANADDLLARGASVAHVYTLDLNDFDAHPAMLEKCFNTLGTVDIALIAHGTLPDQTLCEQDVSQALQEFSSNGLSIIALLTLLANRMQAKGSGTLAVISSVAGDRGRPSNYLYGAAKSAVNTFCEGLRARLFKSGVHVLLIKPGFVDTPMTKDLSLPGLLVVKPEVVAKDIYKAITRRKNTIYTPFFWCGIMLIIKMIPETIFKRLKL
ncbi:MAG: SDR family oxidoreductase [Gammaproteobacteria bacterium]|jgi:short-subunit dehydrogenase